MRGCGRRATRRYSSERFSRRCTSRVIDVSRLFASPLTLPAASSSSSSSMLSPIDESGFRISCVTCAAILPIAASRSFATARLCAVRRRRPCARRRAASSPISSSRLDGRARGVRSPRATARARSVTRSSGPRRRRVWIDTATPTASVSAASSTSWRIARRSRSRAPRPRARSSRDRRARRALQALVRRRAPSRRAPRARD